ncbi:MAG: threonine dehydratase [Rhodospirillaceae bacterium]|jgi:threonine dehydratase|nr:threonine dehydratase [Rhodospirillaceae bacterium]MBT5940386.1 threonine dehydratase [Rhodospirillaceae bacterium]MBT7266223.1 threonine dehydratase [Rhodospirillaceae bacterium]
MDTLSLDELTAGQDIVYRYLKPTPEILWPLLSERAGTEVWVKHENHTPIGAFKVRGGLTYMDHLSREQPDVKGIISATRGNHGQSLAFAAARYGMTLTILVPHGNNPEKNNAMRALGAELIEYGDDYQEAREYAESLAQEKQLHMVGAFHPWILAGVGTYAMEFLTACDDLDVVYVPIGMGSGICGMVSARDALGLKTKIIGVVAEDAASYALSFEQKKAVSTNTADTIADGLACRVPDANALEIILDGVEDVVRVSEEEIKAAMRNYYTDTHNLAEGAAAAPLAALLKQKSDGKKVGLVNSGGNVDAETFRSILRGG